MEGKVDKITLRSAMQDLREEFLSAIFNGYPDHKKLWSGEEIAAEFSRAMYSVAIAYLEREEKEGRNE
jgi:hypothetical protein